MAEQPKYVTTADGRKITYDRWKYEQTVQQEAVLKRVNTLLNDEAANAVSVGASMSQQEYGGLLRAVVPNLLDKWGKVNATAAIQFYDEAQMQWLKTYSQASTKAARSNARRQASRNALARTQGSLAVAQGYAAQFADTYDLVSKTDTVVNFAMKVRAKSGHAPSVDAMNNALTREVASYHRDTILFNSALDPNVNRVQRVAQANACEFCRLMALGSTNGRVRTSTYAVKFHSHCHCTIQPLFEGEDPVRPDYYDEFEQEYAEVYKGNSAKDTLAEWRGLRDRKAAATAPALKEKAYNGFDDFIADSDNWKSLANFEWGENGDSLLHYVVQKQGFNGKPQIVGSLEDLGENPIFRGIHDANGKRGQSLVQEFLTSETHYQGAGIFGNGSYFAQTTSTSTIPAYRIAGEYAQLGDAYHDALSLEQILDSGKVIAAGLKPDAKTMTFADSASVGKHMKSLFAEWEDSVIASGTSISIEDPYQSFAALMAVKGIDAYHIESNGYWVVLNRGALKVKG